MKRKYIYVFLVLILVFLLGFVYSITKINKSNNDKIELYCTYLSQVTEEQFKEIDGIKAVDAVVEYDKSFDQYSIKLFLEVTREMSKEEIESYKTILKRTCSEAALIINGEYK